MQLVPSFLNARIAQMASRAVTAASTALRELRIHVCQKSAASSGVRDFITKQYVPLKKVSRFEILSVR